MVPSRPRLRTSAGCIQCRQRRKKCCEQKPLCMQCERMGLSCSFSASTSCTTDCGEWPHLDVLNEQPQLCAIVFRYKTKTVRIKPKAGQSKDICALLQYYSNNDRFSTCPWNVPSIILQFLPAVVDSTMALAAVTAVLAWFMPADWIARSQSPFRLLQQAVRQLHVTLVDCPLERVPDAALLTVELLHLFQLHSEPDPAQACSHLMAAGSMLQYRLRNKKLKTFISTWTLENYLYHVIATSTVNPTVMTPDLTPSAIMGYFMVLSSRQGCHIADLTLLDISASVLLEIFCISWFRQRILSDPPDTTLWHIKHFGRSRLRVKRTKPNMQSHFLDTIYTHACFLFGCLHICQDTNFNEPLASQFRYGYDRVELQEAIDFVRSRSEPCYVVTWPLFVIGLDSEPGTFRDNVEESFKRLIDNSRLASAESLLGVMRTAWHTQSGLSILLSSDLKPSLVF